jgi:hypothetical protein
MEDTKIARTPHQKIPQNRRNHIRLPKCKKRTIKKYPNVKKEPSKIPKWKESYQIPKMEKELSDRSIWKGTKHNKYRKGKIKKSKK